MRRVGLPFQREVRAGGMCAYGVEKIQSNRSIRKCDYNLNCKVHFFILATQKSLTDQNFSVQLFFPK